MNFKSIFKKYHIFKLDSIVAAIFYQHRKKFFPSKCQKRKKTENSEQRTTSSALHLMKQQLYYSYSVLLASDWIMTVAPRAPELRETVGVDASRVAIAQSPTRTTRL